MYILKASHEISINLKCFVNVEDFFYNYINKFTYEYNFAKSMYNNVLAKILSMCVVMFPQNININSK